MSHLIKNFLSAHITPKNKMSTGKRKSYSIEYKKGIVEESQGKNLTAFCKENKLDLRMVRKWRSDHNKLNQHMNEGNAKKRKCGLGRQPLYSELEDAVFEWVAERRSKALVVRRTDIRKFALTNALQCGIFPEDFKASKNWLDGFLLRHELSLRKSTTLYKLENDEIVKRALSFKSFIDEIDIVLPT